MVGKGVDFDPRVLGDIVEPIKRIGRPRLLEVVTIFELFFEFTMFFLVLTYFEHIVFEVSREQVQVGEFSSNVCVILIPGEHNAGEQDIGHNNNCQNASCLDA